MFRSARLKLTGWYLLIIMIVSITFSGLIYDAFSRELQRGFRRAEIRLRAGDVAAPIPPGFAEEIEPQFIEELAQAKENLTFNLALINLIILGLSSMAGYFLAGKALSPIEKALDEQKRFTADASHELKTPITALKTSIEVALRDKKATKKDLRDILKSNLEDVSGLQSLTSSLLSLSRYQKESESLNFAIIETKSFLEQILKKTASLADKKNIKMKTALKKIKIKADKQSLEELFLILLDNAIKYTPRNGRVELTSRKEAGSIVISIKDNGVGIDKKDLPFIFDRFYRTESSRSKEEYMGFGLGLSIAKKIVSLHGGSISVESKIKKGTTFAIKLPLK